ncbi:hypothetical protein P5V15_011062 [Pogonomyrmex californicus]
MRQLLRDSAAKIFMKGNPVKGVFISREMSRRHKTVHQTIHQTIIVLREKHRFSYISRQSLLNKQIAVTTRVRDESTYLRSKFSSFIYRSGLLACKFAPSCSPAR